MTRRKTSLVLKQAFFGDAMARAAYALLMRQVFDVDIERRDAFAGCDPTCRTFAFFETSGACVASVEIFALPLILDGRQCETIALRSVAVAAAWRGHGLFRDLMFEALVWCDAAAAGPVLLYTEGSALYERFGFRDVQQHRVVGVAPAIDPLADVRRLSLAVDRDVTLIRRLLRERTPVSDQVSVANGSTAFMTQVAADDAMTLDYAEALDALVVSTKTDDRWILVDVVASEIPPLASILRALDQTFDQIAVLFPTDKLGWSGTFQRDDTGLMVRGAWPTAFDRPFMLPPTAEF